MAFYHCISGHGKSFSNIEYIGITTWNNLVNKDDDTLYLITLDSKNIIIMMYIGNNRILQYKDDISDFEFYYENLNFPNASNSSSFDTRFSIDTGINIISSANIGRDFDLEFMCNPENRASGTDCVIIGTLGSSMNSLIECYTLKTTLNQFKIYGWAGNDSDLGDIRNKKVNIKRITVNSIITINTYIDDVLVNQYIVTSANSNDSSDYNLLIGNFKNVYSFGGIINYIGLKWLS